MNRVLVVSDNLDASVCLLNNLRRCNLDYCIVTSGRACLEIVKDDKVCIAVIDNSLIDIPGYKLLELLNSLKPDMRVIFINGTSKPEIELKVRQLGVVFYTSDLRDREIVRVVSRLIAKKKISDFTS